MSSSIAIADLHSTSTMDTLYFLNVIVSSTAYLTIFIEGVLMPFQASLMPKEWGPNWIYILLFFTLQLEYFLWPLEINNYLFKEDDDKVKILAYFSKDSNKQNLERWADKSLVWGGVLAVASFISASVVGTLNEATL